MTYDEHDELSKMNIKGDIKGVVSMKPVKRENCDLTKVSIITLNSGKEIVVDTNTLMIVGVVETAPC